MTLRLVEKDGKIVAETDFVGTLRMIAFRARMRFLYVRARILTCIRKWRARRGI